ncbi:MAG: response regulator [Deltaproteobacteria bacterium]|nr:response regulator [Deltaproteobacteria bacterium]
MEPCRTLAGLRIALIENDDLLRESLAFFLQVQGGLLETFKCAEDAVATVSLGVFGAVISDLLLPGEDGLSLLRRARSASGTVITILITAYRNSNLSDEARHAGVDAILLKPFSTADLENAMQMARIDRESAAGIGLPETGA